MKKKVQQQAPPAPSKYAKLGILELEARVESAHQLAREAQMEMYEILEYLRHSSRFKENPGHKKTTFWQYLEDRFTIRQGTYRENVRAFIKYPQPALDYGVGVVTKVVRLCERKAPKVFEELKKTAASHKKPLPRAAIETIIQKHRTAPKIEKTITDWRAMYEAEWSMHEATRKELVMANMIIADQAVQIDKLKRTVEDFGRVRAVVVEHDKMGTAPPMM